MPLLATAKQPTSKVPVGSFVATCTAIIEDTLKNSKFNDEIYRLYFNVDGKTDEEGNQMTTDAVSSRAFSPKSKLWGWLEAFGLQPVVGKVMDLEAVVGRKVMIVVKQNGEYTRVDDLVPLPEGMAPPAPTRVDDIPFDHSTSLSDELRAKAAAIATTTGGPVVDEETASAWWKARLGEGFERKNVIDLCKEMFGGRIPGELSAEELAGLTDQMNKNA